MSVKVFDKGTRKRLYVDRDRAARTLPPNIVEVFDDNGKIQAKVCGAQVRGFGPFVMCWSGNNTEAPAVWVETYAQAVVLLAEDMPLPQT